MGGWGGSTEEAVRLLGVRDGVALERVVRKGDLAANLATAGSNLRAERSSWTLIDLTAGDLDKMDNFLADEGSFFAEFLVFEAGDWFSGASR